MSESLNIDHIVECVKNIVDSIRCPICDKADGTRATYSCNHVACCDCVAVSECPSCLNPPSTNIPIPNETLTQRVVNAATLLNTCQETFGVDVYRRRKISEHLKVEKELFPECIQAPLKYTNKRKSSYTIRNKENNWRSIFPDESIPLLNESKMEKTMNYVKTWLDNNEKLSKVQTRRPFSDIDINNQQFDSKQKPRVIKRRADIIFNKLIKNNENISSKGTIRKRSYKASYGMVNDQTHLDKYLKPNDKDGTFGFGNIKKLKGDIDVIDITDISSQSKNKPDNDESGIVIEEESFVIDDSQNQILDKDKLALLAVRQADENEETNSNTEVRLECSEVLNYTNDVEKSLSKSFHYINSSIKKSPSLSVGFDNADDKNPKAAVNANVPFYKKAYLYDDCNHNYNEYSDQGTDNLKPVVVTVENDNFITTIKVSKCKENQSIDRLKKCIAVQTNEPVASNETYTRNNVQDTIKEYTGKCTIEKSQDLFADEDKVRNISLSNLDPVNKSEDNVNQMLDVSSLKENRHIIIQDSDSDYAEENVILQIQADVHRSSEQFNYGVLTQIKQSALEHRKPAVARGRTPASTDSSDKENRDPNRPKKKITKKSHKKKCFVDFDNIQILND